MPRTAHLIETLSAREREVLRLIAAGRTNPEIGETLDIRFATAKWYVSEVLQKLQVPSREAAAEEFRRYHGWRARAGRALAAAPLAWRWVAAELPVLVVAALVSVVVIATRDTGRAPAEQWLVAYTAVPASAAGVEPGAIRTGEEPQRIRLIDALTLETWEFGPSLFYGGLAWSPRGDRLVAVSRNPRQLLLLEYPGGDAIPLDDGPVVVHSLYETWWSPDGTRLVTGTAVYDADGMLLAHLDGARQSPPYWSPESEWFAMALDGVLRVYDRDFKLRFESETLPATDLSNLTDLTGTLWLSRTELVFPVSLDAAPDGPFPVMILDLAADPIVARPLTRDNPYEAVFGPRQERLEAIRQDLILSGAEPGPAGSGATDGSWMLPAGGGDCLLTDPGPMLLALSDGVDLHTIEIDVTWCPPSFRGDLGDWISFVILQ